ncbi:MAG: glycogen debranching enzyme N-terminal domain-containing protein [Candidatus Cryptobacteroides sp.]
MSFLQYNKAELVNLSYSLKREIISANKTGAYCNTSIVTCNTRRYHGLLAVTLDRFGGDRYLLLSSLDESLIMQGKQFNLGIHCYGDIYEPRGHKYVVDFQADPVTMITYKVGEIVFTKSLILAPDTDQILVKYELVAAPSPVTLIVKPFLAFRNTHELTHRNPAADPTPARIRGGAAFRLYPSFPDLCVQTSSSAAVYDHHPDWYIGVTYSDEYRRGFDCKEDLMVPGSFELKMKKGDSVVFSAATSEQNPTQLKRKFNAYAAKAPQITGFEDQLKHCADSLVTNHNGRKMICAGLSWLKTGLLRETLFSLPGLTVHAGKPEDFEEILDNLIANEEDRLFSRTTQAEAPLLMTVALQDYIHNGADPKKVWKKYSDTLTRILESYLPGGREEISMQPDGLLWAQKYRTALSWMNAYVNGVPVTERAGYQVETNALWYNAICFALEMEKGNKSFAAKWTPVKDLVEKNYEKKFWCEQNGCLADYVGTEGMNMQVRPNQLFALALDYSPVDPMKIQRILQVFDRELVTRRGIRTLSPRDVSYKGVYDGTQIDRDLAYHQGSTRAFLLLPYVVVCYKVYGAAFNNKAEWLVKGFFDDLGMHGVGAFSELYDGDPPHEPHGTISSALSTAALLEINNLIKKNK